MLARPSRLFLMVLVIGLASLAAIGLQYGLGVQRVSMLYLASVLMVAAWLGVSYGLAAAVLATVAFNFAFSAPAFQLTIGTRQDYANLIVFSVGAWVIGFYADGVQRTRDALARLARPEVIAERDRAGRRFPLRYPARAWQRETVRVIQALALAGGAAAIASLLEEMLGIPQVSILYAVAVVMSAIGLGTRFALITGVACVVAFDYYLTEPRHTLQLDSSQAALNLGVFLTLGWCVGVFAERANHERRAVRSLFDAGRSLSATADEGDLRQIICDAVVAATAGEPVAIRDETGRLDCEHGRAPSRSALRSPGQGQTLAHGTWRTRALSVNERSYGEVTWHSPRTWRQVDAALDQTVNVLVDLGAGALARARLGADNSRMQAIAHAEELRRALLASVSHDLRTPLSGIMGSATSLLDFSEQYAEDVRRDLLENIRDQALRLNRYVENLLGMTRLETGGLKPDLQPVDMEAVVFDVLEDLAASARSTDVDIDERLLALADAGLLRQVMANVMENALKYAPVGSRVEVRSRRVSDQVEISIQDEGPGVREEDLPKLFEPFFRGQDAKASGVGLGLFVAHGFMHAMGGSISAQCRSDGCSGLRVALRLPAGGSAQ